MAIEKILVQYRVVVDQSFGQSRQAGGRDLLERGFVSLMADSTDVQYDSVLRVRHVTKIRR